MNIALSQIGSAAKEWLVTQVHEGAQGAAHHLQPGWHCAGTGAKADLATNRMVSQARGIMQRVRTDRLPADVAEQFTGLSDLYSRDARSIPDAAQGQQLVDLVRSHKPEFARAAQIDWRIMSHTTLKLGGQFAVGYTGASLGLIALRHFDN